MAPLAVRDGVWYTASMGPINSVNTFVRAKPNQPSPSWKIAQSVAGMLKESIVREVEGIYRMYLNVTVPQLRCEHGFARRPLVSADCIEWPW